MLTVAVLLSILIIVRIILKKQVKEVLEHAKYAFRYNFFLGLIISGYLTFFTAAAFSMLI